MKRVNSKRSTIKRRREVYIRKVICSTVLLALFAVVLTGYGFKKVEAKDNGLTVEKYYKSIQIEAGDTLWDIANEYRGNQEIKSYIKEVKKMNNLKSDQINDMSYLTIMYYEQDQV